MTNKFIHLIYVPFVGVGVRPFRGDEWYRYRVEIFKKYTLNSLLKQTKRNAILWLSFIDEVRDNPITLELAEYLREKGIVVFMTFDGLMYHDDKFDTGFKEGCMNFARIVRMAYREKNLIRFGWKTILKNFFENKNATLKERLTSALSHLKILDNDSFDWVYVTRIDSDDMFHKDFVSEVQEFQPFPGALTCRNGYVYNSNTDQLAEWNPKTHPPFHTIIFPKQNFFDAARYIQYFKGFKSHEDIPNVFNSQNLKDGRYCVLIHQMHISTLYEHPFRGKEIEGDEKKEILNKFI